MAKNTQLAEKLEEQYEGFRTSKCFGLNITLGCRGEKKAAAKKEKDLIKQQQDIDPYFFY